jgi:hypothetical protein
MQMEASGEDVPPRVELWNEYSVPEINIPVVGFDGLRGAHDQDARLLKVVFLNAIAALVTRLTALTVAIVPQMILPPPTSPLGMSPEPATSPPKCDVTTSGGWLAVHP